MIFDCAAAGIDSESCRKFRKEVLLQTTGNGGLSENVLHPSALLALPHTVVQSSST